MNKPNLFFLIVLLAVESGAVAMEPAPDQFNAQLIAAAASDNAPEVKRLLALRPDLTFMDEVLQHALQVAGINRHERVLHMLLRQYAQSKVNGGTALMAGMMEKPAGEPDIEQSIKQIVAKRLIEYGCDVNSALHEHGPHYGWTVLHFAAAADNEGICKLLLDAGARIDVRDARGSTPLIEAAKGRKLEYSSLLAKSLVRYLRQRNNTVMTVMLCFNRLRNEGNACAQLLYRQFIPLLGRYFAPYVPLEKLLRVRDQDGRKAYDYTPLACLKPLDFNELMVRPVSPIQSSQFEDLNYKLVEAARDGKFEKVRRLLAAGADTKCYAGFALDVAIREGHEEVCRLLLASGADVNMRSVATPLFAAAEQNDASLCKLLLEAGADVNLQADQPRPDKPSVLHQVVQGYEYENDGAALCQLLLDSGARMDLRNDLGNTPLICAAERAHQRFEAGLICELMINHPGLAVYSSRQQILRMKNNAGLTAHDHLAIECLNPDVADNSEDNGSIMSWLAGCSVQ